MRILDVNLLLYATNRDLPHHTRAKTWFDATLGADELVGLPWVVLLAFLRLSTSALAIEHGATLCSADSDFGRFRQLKWRNPIA
ncbi:MAG: hypothetical protein ACQEXJ_06320 [Myxococcota bacterium]